MSRFPVLALALAPALGLALVLPLSGCASLGGQGNKNSLTLTDTSIDEFTPVPVDQIVGAAAYDFGGKKESVEWIACRGKKPAATFFVMHRDRAGYDREDFCRGWIAQSFVSQGFDVISVNRPGYGASEPFEPVTDIRIQAEALAPLLVAARGQKVMLVGQSYGAAIASLMAEAKPGQVASLVLLSGFFGETGPTSRWLLDLGGKALKMIPRDLRHAVIEVTGQRPQLAYARRALARLTIPIHMVHGDKDDFAPIEVAERLAAETVTRNPIRFARTAGANHFLNDGPTDQLIAALEACIPVRQPWAFRWPQLPKVDLGKLPRLSPPAAA